MFIYFNIRTDVLVRTMNTGKSINCTRCFFRYYKFIMKCFNFLLNVCYSSGNMVFSPFSIYKCVFDAISNLIQSSKIEINSLWCDSHRSARRKDTSHSSDYIIEKNYDDLCGYWLLLFLFTLTTYHAAASYLCLLDNLSKLDHASLWVHSNRLVHRIDRFCYGFSQIEAHLCKTRQFLTHLIQPPYL